MEMHLYLRMENDGILVENVFHSFKKLTFFGKLIHIFARNFGDFENHDFEEAQWRSG